MKTIEVNPVTSEEDVFVSDNYHRTGQQLRQYYVTPVNPEITRQFSHEHLLLHRPKIITPSSGGSDWSNP